jgi:hypothetical protein
VRGRGEREWNGRSGRREESGMGGSGIWGRLGHGHADRRALIGPKSLYYSTKQKESESGTAANKAASISARTARPPASRECAVAKGMNCGY